MIARRFLFSSQRWIVLIGLAALFVLGSVSFMQIHSDRRTPDGNEMYDDSKKITAEFRKREDYREGVAEAKNADNIPFAANSMTSIARPSRAVPEAEKCQSAVDNPVRATYDVNEMASSLKTSEMKWNGDNGVWDSDIENKFQEAYHSTAEHNRTLKVFLVPFSHADPGWLLTVDQYLEVYTKHTLDLMVERLHMWKDMTFVWAEVSFFEMWWNALQNETTKDQVRSLIAEGRLEFINGGYVMPDEATSHYYAIIHQYIYGHNWLKRTFNVTTKHGFSIDPFGYSSTMPYILRNLGFDSMYIQRIHYILRKKLLFNRASQFLWQQSWDARNTDSMFCYMSHGKLYDIKYTCGVEHNVCSQFDYQDQQMMSDSQTEEAGNAMVNQFRKTAYMYPHNVLMVPLGMDFGWSKITEWDSKYGNFKQIMEYLNKTPKHRVNIQWGTFTDYYDAVFKEMGKPGLQWKVPVIKGDFFPYADKYTDYWTGYFTSHPYQKSLSRMLEQKLRTAEILYSISLLRKLKLDDKMVVEHLRAATRHLGLYQHHDGITGTSKQRVSDDYELRLLDGLRKIDTAITYMATVLFWSNDSLHERFESNIIIEQNRDLPSKKLIRLKSNTLTKYVVLFNQLPSSRQSVIDLFVDTDNVIIEDQNYKMIPYQVSPMMNPQSANGYFFKAGFRLTFITTLETIGFVTFKIRSADESAALGKRSTRITPKVTDFSSNILLSNSFLSAELSATNGLLEAITDHSTGKRHLIRLEFKRYETSQSGAYLFIPSGVADMAPYAHTVRILEGPIYSEIHVILPGVLCHVLRMYHTDGDLGRFLDVNNVDNLSSHRNLEAVMRFTTDMRNNVTFFTDANGFQMMKRRSSPDLPMQANYYPATNMAFMQDAGARLTLHLGRAHGVGSQDVGQIEVMFDRILAQDDARGVEEALTDFRAVNTQMRIHFETGGFCHKCSSADPTSLANRINLDLNNALVILTANHNGNETDDADKLTKLTAALPCDTHLVMLKPLNNSEQLGAIFHKLGTDCDNGETGRCAKENQVDLGEFLHPKIRNVTKTTLNFVTAINVNDNLFVELERKKLTGVTFRIP